MVYRTMTFDPSLGQPTQGEYFVFISLSDAHGNWVVFYEGNKIYPRRVACFALNEYTSGNRKIVPVVHGGGGKLVDANSIGKIVALQWEDDIQSAVPDADADNAGSNGEDDIETSAPSTKIWPPRRDPVPDLEDEEIE